MWYVSIWIYGVFRYLDSTAILTTTRDQTKHLELVQRPSPKIIAILHRRQPTLWLHDLYLEVLSLHYNELHLFGAMAFCYTINIAHLLLLSMRFLFLQLYLKFWWQQLSYYAYKILCEVQIMWWTYDLLADFWHL